MFLSAFEHYRKDRKSLTNHMNLLGNHIKIKYKVRNHKNSLEINANHANMREQKCKICVAEIEHFAGRGYFDFSIAYGIGSARWCISERGDTYWITSNRLKSRMANEHERNDGSEMNPAQFVTCKDPPTPSGSLACQSFFP